jgi:hypothetical protein
VFSCLDSDGNGFLDREELKGGFNAMVFGFHSLFACFPILMGYIVD